MNVVQMDINDVLKLLLVHLQKGNMDHAIALLESVIEQLERMESENGSG